MGGPQLEVGQCHSCRRKEGMHSINCPEAYRESNRMSNRSPGYTADPEPAPAETSTTE